MKLDKNKEPINKTETDDLDVDDDDLEDTAAEGDEDEDDEDDDEDPEDEDEDDDSEDSDDDEDEDDSEDDDADEDGEGDEEDSEDDDDEDPSPAEKKSRAQKRIKQLIGKTKDAQRRVKALEAELAEARKLSGDDGQAILSAAEKAGVLPSLMNTEVAKGLEQLEKDRAVANRLDELLDGDDEEFEIGGTQYSRRQIERLLKKRQDAIAEGERKYGPARDKAVKRARAVFELGLKARKAGWDGETPVAKKKNSKTAKGGKPNAKTSKAAKKAKPSKRKKVDFTSASTSEEMLDLIERTL